MAAPQKNHHETPLFSNASKSGKQWNACYRQWIAGIASPLTRLQHDNTLRRFFAFLRERYGRETLPDKVTSDDIEEFLRLPALCGRNKGQPLSPYSKNAYLMALRSFYAYCKKNKVEFREKMVPILRGEKPTDDVKRAKMGDVDRDLTDEEIIRFFSVIPDTPVGMRDRALFLCYFWTGRRRIEFLGLRWKDLEETIFEDGHRGWLYSWKGKGHVNRDDSAELPEPAFMALKEYLVATGRWGNMQPDDPLFPGLTGPAIGSQPLNVNSVNKRFRKYADLANLPQEKCVHSLRYAAAWERYEANGHDPIAVQQDMRHRDIHTTMRYLHKRARKKQADVVARKLYGKWGNL